LCFITDVIEIVGNVSGQSLN